MASLPDDLQVLRQAAERAMAQVQSGSSRREQVTGMQSPMLGPTGGSDPAIRGNYNPRFSTERLGLTAQRAMGEAGVTPADVPIDFGVNATPTFGAISGRSGQIGYVDGDEYRIFEGLSANQIALIQHQMVLGGFIKDTDKIVPGNWESTRADFQNLLEASNSLGVTWQQALEQFAAPTLDMMGGLSGGPGGGGGGRQAPTYVAPNRDDLSRAIKTGLYTQFGTYDNAVDVDSLVDQYLAMHRANFDAQVGLAMGGGGGSVEDVESLEGFVERRAREEDPMGVESRDFLDRANQFFDMLGGVV